MRPTVADTATGLSIGSATFASLSLNHIAAIVAILSGLYAVYDRWDRRRRALKPPSE